MPDYNAKMYDYLLSVLDKADAGPYAESAVFDRQHIFETIKALIEKYDISWEQDTFVPADDALADRLFEAGMELARETGVYCIDSQRRMLWSQEELEWALDTMPTEVTLGEGKDKTIITKRRPEQAGRIPITSGAMGIPVPEDLFIPVMVSIAQEPLVDAIDNASLLTTHGRPIRAGGSPWEIVACWQEVDLIFEVLERVGRPGMAIGCAENAHTERGELATNTRGGFRPTDWHHIAMISELKLSYSDLIRAVQCVRTGVAVTHGFYNPILGGFSGGPAGVAIACVAGLILMRAAYGVPTMNAGPVHPVLGCNTNPELMGAQAVAFQALSRNTNLLVANFVHPVGGPGTKDLLYETAAHALMAVPSGVSFCEGVHSAAGNHTSHTSGLESRFLAQVANAAAGLTRVEADAVVQKLVSLYAANQAARPIGKPFDQVYDLDTIRPTPEWQQLYADVITEINELGFNIEIM